MICSPGGALSGSNLIPAWSVRAGGWAWALLVIALAVSPAPGQASPAPGGAVSFKPIDDAAKKSTSLTPDISAAIDASIKEKVALLAADNAGEQSRARQWLINETTLTGGVAATPAYLNAYEGSVARHVAPLLKDPSPRVRLNAAIVVAETAKNTGGVQLAPVAIVLLKDDSDAIVLWGMKAARWIIPAQLRVVGGFDKKLADAVVPTVTKHTQGSAAGAIVVEAYDALTLDVLDPVRWPKVTTQQVTTIAPYVVGLLQARIPMYQKGVPPAPRADATGTRFLVDPKTWPALGQQQGVVKQLMADLISLAAGQAPTANQGDLAELAQMVQRVALAVATLAGPQGPAVQQAANFNLTTAGAAQIQAVDAAVRTALPGLKPAPAIQGNEPAPPPASAPTTGPVLIPGDDEPAPPGAPPVNVPPGTAPAPGRPPAAPKAPAPANAPPAGAAGAPGAGAGAGTTPPPPAR